MEKNADYEYVVFKKEGKLFLKFPGGNTIPYDNRFSNLPHISEGGSFSKPLED